MIPEPIFTDTFAKVGYLCLKIFKVHDNASIRSERMFGKGKLDEIQSDNCIRKCSHDVPFDKKIID